MSSIPSFRTSFIFIVAGMVLASAPMRAAGEPLVNLDAAGLREGSLSAWTNAGTLGGTFRDDGTHPQVKVIDGTKAVDFSGKDRLVADILAPASLAGDHAWTCVVRVWARDVSRHGVVGEPPRELHRDRGWRSVRSRSTWGRRTRGGSTPSMPPARSRSGERCRPSRRRA